MAKVTLVFTPKNLIGAVNEVRVNQFVESISRTEVVSVKSTSYAILGLVFICAATFSALSITESLFKTAQP